jgi:hypothetical protein
MGNPNRSKPATPVVEKVRGKSPAQVRKQARIDEQAAREAYNRVLRAEGTPTPWEEAQAARAARREPLREAWLARRGS